MLQQSKSYHQFSGGRGLNYLGELHPKQAGTKNSLRLQPDKIRPNEIISLWPIVIGHSCATLLEIREQN